MQTNIVIPYHKGNSELAVKLIKLIAHHGHNHGRSAWLCPTDDVVSNDRNFILEAARKNFTFVKYVRLDQQYIDPACRINQQFFNTAMVAIQEFQGPWFWLTPDCVPLQRDWLDKLERDYQRSRLSVLGRLIKESDTEDGIRILRRIHGNAIYSNDIISQSPLLNNLGKYTYSYAQSQMSPQIFDRYLSTEVQRIGGNTELIGYYPGSVGYRKSGETYKFEAKDPDHLSILKTLHPAMVVEEDNVLVCGCEDGSLHDLLMKEPEELKEKEPAKRKVHRKARRRRDIKL
jgi:hypothetical protein